MTYTFDLNFVLGPDGKTKFESAGYQAYQHMLIHNDLVSLYGFDDTGVLAEGLSGASSAPSDPNSVASANNGNSASLSWTPAPPPVNDNCTNVSLASVGRQSMSVTTQGITFTPTTFYNQYRY